MNSILSKIVVLTVALAFALPACKSSGGGGGTLDSCYAQCKRDNANDVSKLLAAGQTPGTAQEKKLEGCKSACLAKLQ